MNLTILYQHILSKAKCAHQTAVDNILRNGSIEKKNEWPPLSMTP